jgi:hypothetical protein
MRYELSDYEWTAIKPTVPNQQRFRLRHCILPWPSRCAVSYAVLQNLLYGIINLPD